VSTAVALGYKWLGSAQFKSATAADTPATKRYGGFPICMEQAYQRPD
jgi:hypothetical protein